MVSLSNANTQLGGSAQAVHSPLPGQPDTFANQRPPLCLHEALCLPVLTNLAFSILHAPAQALESPVAIYSCVAISNVAVGW